MARILSLDYGSKRVGVAVTDPSQIIATGLKTVDRKNLDDFLKDYLSSEQVEKIIIGYPSHPDGNKLPICFEIDAYIDNTLQLLFPDLPVIKQNENYTSYQAQQIIMDSGLKKSVRKNKRLIDEVSAVLILQRYLGHI